LSFFLDEGSFEELLEILSSFFFYPMPTIF
jgi:hypothetical protein